MDIFAVTSQEVLEKISRHCPESMSVYFQCINRCDEDGNVFFSRNLIEIEMSENYRTFKNNIKKLARENLLEWHPIDKGINVILSSLNDD